MKDALSQLRPIFISGNYDAFLEKEAEIDKESPNFLASYHNNQGGNPVHQFLSSGIVTENIKLTQYIEDKVNIPLRLDLYALLCVGWNLQEHLVYYFNKYGKDFLTLVLQCRDLSKNKELVKIILELDPVLNKFVTSLGIENFTSLDDLSFLNEDNADNFNKILQSVFDKVTPYILKKVSSIVKDGNIKHLNSLFVIKQLCPEISDDKIINLPIAKETHLGSMIQYVDELKMIFAQENLERRFNFFTKTMASGRGNDERSIADIIDMYKALKEKLEIVDLKKVADFYELHEKLNKQLAELGQADLNFDSRFSHLDNKTIGEYTIKIPKNSKELIDVGTNLSICVGNGIYAYKFHIKKLDILFLEKNGSVNVCIEVTPNNYLRQMMLKDNVAFSETLVIESLKKLIEQ